MANAVGIVGYGSYIPRYRLKVEDIAKANRADGKAIISSLGVYEKSVPNYNEDTITIATEAARNAVEYAGIDPKEIGAIYVGSESHPYAVKPSAVTVGEAIGAAPWFTAADLEFACKAGTAGIQACIGLVAADIIKYGMSIGADTAQSKPGDALEYTASAGGAAYIIGRSEPIAVFEKNLTVSYTTDTPDFWRRERSRYPEHGGRFTGSEAYFKHVINAARRMMELLGRKPEDYDYLVLHMPNCKFPLRASKILGFKLEQIRPSLEVVKNIGNTYSGSSLLGLARVLDDFAEPGDHILMVSYGSGAGSDAFSLEVTDKIEEKKGRTKRVDDYIQDKIYIDYVTYLNHTGVIIK